MILKGCALLPIDLMGSILMVHCPDYFLGMPVIPFSLLRSCKISFWTRKNGEECQTTQIHSVLLKRPRRKTKSKVKVISFKLNFIVLLLTHFLLFRNPNALLAKPLGLVLSVLDGMCLVEVLHQIPRRGGLVWAEVAVLLHAQMRVDVVLQHPL